MGRKGSLVNHCHVHMTDHLWRYIFLPLLTEQCPYFSNSPMMMILDVYSVMSVVQNLKRVQSVARQTN